MDVFNIFLIFLMGCIGIGLVIGSLYLGGVCSVVTLFGETDECPADPDPDDGDGDGPPSCSSFTGCPSEQVVNGTSTGNTVAECCIDPAPNTCGQEFTGTCPAGKTRNSALSCPTDGDCDVDHCCQTVTTSSSGGGGGYAELRTVGQTCKGALDENGDLYSDSQIPADGSMQCGENLHCVRTGRREAAGTWGGPKWKSSECTGSTCDVCMKSCSDISQGQIQDNFYIKANWEGTTTKCVASSVYVTNNDGSASKRGIITTRNLTGNRETENTAIEHSGDVCPNSCICREGCTDVQTSGTADWGWQTGDHRSALYCYDRPQEQGRIDPHPDCAYMPGHAEYNDNIEK